MSNALKFDVVSVRVVDDPKSKKYVVCLDKYIVFCFFNDTAEMA